MTAYRDRMLAGEYDPKAKGSAKKAKAAEAKRAGRATTTGKLKGLRGR